MDLDALYAAAGEDNVFFAEYNGMPAAAGDLRDLEWLAAHADPPRTAEALLGELVSSFMGAIVDLCVLGQVTGEDRVANCQSAWDEFKAHRDKGQYPRVAGVRESLGLPVTDTKRLGTF